MKPNIATADSPHSFAETLILVFLFSFIISIAAFVWWAFKLNNPSGTLPAATEYKSEREICAESGGVLIHASGNDNGYACLSRESIIKTKS